MPPADCFYVWSELKFHSHRSMARNNLLTPVVPDGKRAIVYRDKNGKAEAVAVKAGRTENGRTEILEEMDRFENVGQTQKAPVAMMSSRCLQLDLASSQ